jgi:hypothetical protein
LLLSLDPYLCWWTISPRGYQPPNSHCFDIDIVRVKNSKHVYVIDKRTGESKRVFRRSKNGGGISMPGRGSFRHKTFRRFFKVLIACGLAKLVLISTGLRSLILENKQFLIKKFN